MLNTNVFNYINVLDKAADATWQRNDILANNIANATTPGYKRRDIDFESQLKTALNRSRYSSIDSRIDNVKMNRLNPDVYTDAANYSYRMDGNNVDIETENVSLAANQLRYNGIVSSVSMEFKNLQLVMR